MPTELLIYEYPLNERMRTLLRLEHLFALADHSLQGNSTWDSRNTLSALVNIINTFERNDLKTEVIKELDRHSNTLKRLENTPNIDNRKLKRILSDLNELYKTMQGTRGRFGQNLRDNELLNALKQKSSVPGGTCQADLPVLYHWLQLPANQRKVMLNEWLDEFFDIRAATELILELTRNSAHPEAKQALAGYYQENLEPAPPCQLLRIGISAKSSLLPEVSGSRHRISIRFLHTDGVGRPQSHTTPIDFQLTCCAI